MSPARTWSTPLVVALAGAAAVNLGLSALGVEHDPLLIAVLALAVAALLLVVVEVLDPRPPLTWLARLPNERADTGEDSHTEELRWLVEAHVASQGADDAVLWKLADLASRRMRQVHGVSWADDPRRTTELLGPQLAEWVSHDRRHRYDPAHHRHRHSLAQLGEVLRRIEDL